jgi:hypothetical protein
MSKILLSLIVEAINKPREEFGKQPYSFTLGIQIMFDNRK